jgi:UDP-N-acetylmuramyl tripeptide synthase
MDYHPTVEDYHRAKLRLFDTLLPKGAPAIVFADDPWSEPTIKAAKAAGLKVLTVGRHGDFLTLKRVEHERRRQRAEIVADGVLHEVDLPLAGDFQIANALVSAGLAIATGTIAAKALAALEKLKGAPGRLDLVGTTAAGAFTNLGRDHMDYHPTVEDYHRAKLRLFDTLLPKGAPAVVFADDPWSEPTIKAAKAAGLNVLTVGRHGDFLTLKRVEHERHRQRAEIVADGVLHEVDLPLAGDFQIANALVSAGLAISTGTPADKALAALEKLKGAPGRLDLVGTTGAGAPVYVDYAHKPDALENVLTSVRPFTTGRVVVVFGCGGDRDRGKRPIMGEIATRLADIVIVTDDNPRSEVPETIRAAILAAAPGAIEIGDRRKAIHEAVAMLRAGDTLIVAGKGHEEGQTIGSETFHFSDHEEVRDALKERAA